MAFIQMNLFSESLMRTVNVNVILPIDKVRGDGSALRDSKPFPTLYLLHGILGSQVDWVNGTKLQRWAEEKDLAVVMPAGENSFYVDREATHELFGKFIGEELVELTRRAFPLSRNRADTFIGGLSMGGYGALRNGLKYHKTFGRIIALSSADIVDGLEARTDGPGPFFETRSYAEGIFGDLSKVKNSDMDIKWLAAKLCQENAASAAGCADVTAASAAGCADVAATTASAPALYMACGTEDFLLPANRSLRDCFARCGFDLTYEEGPGGHEWDFWNDYIKRAIDWLPLGGTAGINSGNILPA